MYKLKFIMHKLSLSSEEVLTRLSEYIDGPTKDTRYALPPEYISAVRSLLENDLRLPPWLTQTVKTQVTVRWKLLDR